MGFHPTELVIIFVVALLIFGPKKLPEIGSQMGRTINAFKKGFREIRDPIENSFDLEAFTAQQREIKSLEARRLELEILERELAVKRAEAALKATQEGGVVTYDAATTVEADYAERYVESEKIVDAESITPQEVTHTSTEPAETAEPVKAAQPVNAAEPVNAKESVKTAKPVNAEEPARVAEPVKTVETVSETNAHSKVSVEAE
jgi:TatA/E family protein of Tat protein translocase